jgi:hypothetical protein
MMRRLASMSCTLALAMPLLADQPSVQVQPPDVHGSRPLEPQTETAVVRDYLESWEAFSRAFRENEPGALDPDFVGTARDKLGATVVAQQKLGIRTRYEDARHNLQIVFYSPQGLSIDLVDHVEYDEQVLNGATVLATQHVRARYLVVMTPAAMRWNVRIFQAGPDQGTEPVDGGGAER